MTCTGRSLALGCLLLLTPLLANAGGNSLLIPATSRCALNTVPEAMREALRACEQAASEGDLQAAFELGEYYYDGRRAPRDLSNALHWFEQASLHGHAQAQHRLGVMFFPPAVIMMSFLRSRIVRSPLASIVPTSPV